MRDTVGVRFQTAGRVHYCDPLGLELSVGDRVSVDTDEGEREGEVVIAPGQVIHSDLRGPMDAVLRKIVAASVGSRLRGNDEEGGRD